MYQNTCSVCGETFVSRSKRVYYCGCSLPDDAEPAPAQLSPEMREGLNRARLWLLGDATLCDSRHDYDRAASSRAAAHYIADRLLAD